VFYPGTEVGQKHDWSVKVGDTYENYSTSIFSFTKTTRFAYRTQPRIDYSYSDVIMSEMAQNLSTLLQKTGFQ